LSFPKCSGEKYPPYFVIFMKKIDFHIVRFNNSMRASTNRPLELQQFIETPFEIRFPYCLVLDAL
jgi:hypothetical protein